MNKSKRENGLLSRFRIFTHQIIFEAETPGGKLFDVLLIFGILLSVLIVILDSIKALHAQLGGIFYLLEWSFTIGFTIEYFLRIFSIGKPVKYMFSFFGIVDLLAVLPTYISLFFPGSQFLGVVRVLRVLW